MPLRLLFNLTRWLADEMELPTEDRKTLQPFIYRVANHSSEDEPPEAAFLNSFFLEDIERVIAVIQQKGTVGTALVHYLTGKRSRDGVDATTRLDVLQDLAAPRRIPAVRWPGPGRHALSLMQQIAVNHVAHELRNAGIVAVNGPPGTGKTTMLRDIIAHVLLERARVMATYDDPLHAFLQPVPVSLGGETLPAYPVHPALLGFEMVVASSNNKAVENISRELPLRKAIANDFDPPISYFSEIANAVASQGTADKHHQKGSEAWGLVAAVLGKKANRMAFVRAFWNRKNWGMKAYLSAIVGFEQPNGTAQPLPDIAITEKAPRSRDEAIRRWEHARRKFREAEQRVQEMLDRLEAAREALARQPHVHQRVTAAAQEVEQCRSAYQQALAHVQEARRHFDAAMAQLQAAERDRDTLRQVSNQAFWHDGYGERNTRHGGPV